MSIVAHWQISTLILFTVYCLLPISSTAQGENNIWHFGFNAGLDFNGGSPVGIPGNVNTLEGCATISDKNGNLLFSTDGTGVKDRTGAFMPNADSSGWDKMLSGGQSSAQCVLITPVLASTNRYYIFTVDGKTTFSMPIGPKGAYDGLYYTVVDMTLNGGKGDIDTAFIHCMGYGGNKIPLIDSTHEKIAAVPHANGIDYWVFTRRIDSDFYAFLIAYGGVDTTAVISIIGNGGDGGMTSILASLDGNNIVSCELGSSGGWIEYYDFNQNTGILSNNRTIDSGIIAPYGIAFSPNDSVIYITNVNFNPNILSFERYASPISSSKRTFTSGSGTVRLAPDGTIIVSRGVNSVGRINNPNNAAAPDIIVNAITLSPGTTGQYGLQNIFIPKEKIITICKGESIRIGSTPLPGVTYSWSPNDGSIDSINIANPTVTPTNTTTYIVTIFNNCQTLYDSITVNVEDCDTTKNDTTKPIFFIPNSFSPNGDANNDILFVRGSGIKNLKLFIYNRWGEKVFESIDISKGWDGTYKRKPLNTAVFAWYAEVEFVDDSKIYRKGNVSLIR